MNDKQIYAALEITNHEVRLMIGEFFNTRFNVISKVERVSCSGLAYNGITDRQSVVNAIAKATQNAEKMLGSKIQKVLLAMPSYNMKRYSVKSTVRIQGMNQEITVEDVRRAIKKAESIQIDKAYALIQTVCVKYTVNGITSRRVPIGEKADELTVDIDLLCADRKFSFEVVKCVEEAGLGILDLYLDVYAVSKEAALFEQAVDQNVIVLKVERESTTLGLLAKGRLNSCIVSDKGVGLFAGAVKEAYGLNSADASDLVKYSVDLNKTNPNDQPVYVFQKNGEASMISEKQLYTSVLPKVNEWIEEVENLCTPILQAGKTTVIITGEGGEMSGLTDLLRSRLGCEVRNYIPETLGARNAGLSATLGLFYSYKDRQPLSGSLDASIDVDAFVKSISYRENRAAGNPEDTITRKLKGILFDTKK